MIKTSAKKVIVCSLLWLLPMTNFSFSAEKQTVWLRCVIKSAASQKISRKDVNKAFSECASLEADYNSYLIKIAIIDKKYTASFIIRDLKAKIKIEIKKAEGN